jgi:uncharacterized membrane protein YiaA
MTAPNEPNRVAEALKLNYSDTTKIWLTEQNTLRKLVGVLGMLLPALLWLFLRIFSGRVEGLESMSHYYYTRSNGVFTITISLLAIFLMIYRGKEPIDFWLSTVAGVFALCVLMFPTSNLIKLCQDVCLPESRYAITFIVEDKARIAFHFLSAGIFLFSLAMMALFIFTKSDKKNPADRTPQKRTRNKIYRTCGALMITAILMVAFGDKIFSEEFYASHNLTFWMETVAVESFGLSWVIKAEMIPFLND